MWDFRNRVAIVTGAAQGMGREFALQLAAQGARVAACDIDESTLASLGEIARTKPVLLRKLDVADADARKTFVEEVRAELGPIDVLINNAGVGTSGAFLDISGEDWTWIRSINLDAPIDFMRLVLPDMMAKRDGRILNVASVSGLMVQPYVFGYVATKHALVGLSRSVHQELRPHGIRLTVACPGLVQTTIIDRVRTRNIDVSATRPLFRFGITAEVAVARMLRALQRGVAITIPNVDARVTYQLYRLWPGLWESLLGWIANRAYTNQSRRR